MATEDIARPSTAPEPTGPAQPEFEAAPHPDGAPAVPERSATERGVVSPAPFSERRAPAQRSSSPLSAGSSNLGSRCATPAEAVTRPPTEGGRPASSRPETAGLASMAAVSASQASSRPTTPLGPASPEASTTLGSVGHGEESAHGLHPTSGMSTPREHSAVPVSARSTKSVSIASARGRQDEAAPGSQDVRVDAEGAELVSISASATVRPKRDVRGLFKKKAEEIVREKRLGMMKRFASQALQATLHRVEQCAPLLRLRCSLVLRCQPCSTRRQGRCVCTGAVNLMLLGGGREPLAGCPRTLCRCCRGDNMLQTGGRSAAKAHLSEECWTCWSELG